MTPQIKPATQRKQESNAGTIVFNWRLIIISVLVASCVLGATHWRYRSQLRRTTADLLDRADELEAEGKWRQASQSLYDYVRMKPDDAATWYRLANLYGEFAETDRDRTRAVELHSMALGVLADTEEDERQDLYEGMADLLIELRRYGDAEQLVLVDKVTGQAKITNQVVAKRVEALVKGWRTFTGDLLTNDEVLGTLEEAVKLNPGNIMLTSLAAQLLREGVSKDTTHDDQLKADTFMDDLVQHWDDSGDEDQFALALLAKHRYDVAYRPALVGPSLERALVLETDDRRIKHDVLIAVGDASRRKAALLQTDSVRRDALVEAAGYYRQAFELVPESMAAHLGYGLCWEAAGDLEAAIDAWCRGIQKVGRTEDTIELRIKVIEAMLALGAVENQRIADARAEWKELDRAAKSVLNALPWDAPQRIAIDLRSRVLLLDAHLLIRENDPEKAKDSIWETAQFYSRNSDTKSREIGIAAKRVLAMALSKIPDWEAAAAVYEELMAEEPGSATWVMAAAEAWRRAGQTDKATEYYQLATEKDEASDLTWLVAVETELKSQLWRSRELRDWAEFDRLVAIGKQRFPQAWQFYVLDANRQMSSTVSFDASAYAEKKQAAVELLNASESTSPKDANLWRLLVAAYEKLGLPDEADRALNRLESLADVDPTALAMTRAKLMWSRGKIDEAREVLDAAVKQAVGEQEQSLWWALARLNVLAGDVDVGKQQFLRLSKPRDVKTLFALAEVDLIRGDSQGVKKWEDQLATLEGTEGVRWRYVRARRLLLDNEKNAATTAKTIVDEILHRAAHWNAAHVLKGDLHLLRREPDTAVQSFVTAIRLGDARLETLEKLMSALFAADRFQEANKFLDMLTDVGIPSMRLSSMSISVAAQAGDWTAALRRAQRTAREHSENPMSQIWLAQVYAAQGNFEAAEQEFDQAIERWPKDIRSWQALLAFRGQSRDTKGLSETLAALAAQAGLPESRRAHLLAYGYEVLGEFARAEEFYRQALASDATNLKLRFQFSQHLSRQRKFDDAETQVRKILEQQSGHTLARRLLASLLARKGGEAAWAEIEQLLTEQDQLPDGQPDSRRFLAILYSRDADAKRREQAVAILEEIVNDGKAVAGDRLLLTQLYVKAADYQSVKRHFEALVDDKRDAVTHLPAFIQFLIEQEDFDRASELLIRYETMIGSDGRSRLRFINLQASWYVASGSREMASRWIDEQVEAVLDGPLEVEAETVYAFAGTLFSRFSMHIAAEPWFRKLVQVNPTQYPLLAFNLARQGKVADALNLCVGGPREKDREFVRVVVSILLGPNVPPPYFERMEPMLEEALQANPKDVEILFDIANLRAARERHEESKRLLLRAAELRPNDVRILNNLATVLAEEEGNERVALRYVDRAIEVAGELSMLLDTKGTILTTLDPPEAVNILEQAIAVETPDPRIFLHLAKAYSINRQDAKAMEAMQRAISLDVESLVLTRSDRSILTDLSNKFPAESF